MAFIDPVCHMVVDPTSANTAVVSGRQHVYFCSSSCRDRYLADPSAYPLTDPPQHQAAPRRALSAIGFAVAGAVGASAALLVLYFALLAALSGWGFTRDEFARYWPYIITLAAGFGMQVGLFLFLRSFHAGHAGKVVAASGGTSGAAMVSCCSHYLVNLLPALGATGLVSLIGQYQVELFWIGIAANLAGIAYVGRGVIAFLKEAR